MLKLNEVKSILREYHIRPSKRLGQNFLIDQNIKDKIIDSIELDSGATILEIGPGMGALTPDLCRIGGKVVAIEKDTALYNLLVNRSSFNPSNLKLINGDILRYKFENISSKVTVVGNLPYYISTPILTHLIENRDSINTIYITVQLEVAQRIIAAPDNKDYSSISCYIQFYGEPKALFKISKNAFSPIPKVDSCFLKIAIRGQKFAVNEEILFKIIRRAFEKRRKTIVNSLSSEAFLSKEDASTALDKVGIHPSRRPETISLQEFIKLANIINSA